MSKIVPKTDRQIEAGFAPKAPPSTTGDFLGTDNALITAAYYYIVFGSSWSEFAQMEEATTTAGDISDMDSGIPAALR